MRTKMALILVALAGFNVFSIHTSTLEGYDNLGGIPNFKCTMTSCNNGKCMVTSFLNETNMVCCGSGQLNAPVCVWQTGSRCFYTGRPAGQCSECRPIGIFCPNQFGNSCKGDPNGMNAQIDRCNG